MSAKKLIEPRDMEHRLETAFQPVSPSRKFVQRMRSRIKLAPSVVVAERLNDTPRVVLVVAGVVAGALLLASGVRAIFYLVNKSKM